MDNLLTLVLGFGIFFVYIRFLLWISAKIDANNSLLDAQKFRWKLFVFFFPLFGVILYFAIPGKQG
jgi:hypothetical protein